VIAWLEGVLREKTPTRAVLDVNGVGYELLIPLSTFAALPDEGKTLSLQVHTHVREEAIQLFGFATARERAVFQLLLRASRVGPRLAQTILSGIAAEDLVGAIRSGDLRALRGVPGVGPKMAERIAVELRDRAAEVAGILGSGEPGAPRDEGAELADHALSALLNLGYPRAKADRVVEAATREAGEGASLEAVIRIALRGLGQ
jgi:Holliday junction DNA helicase RuvA